ncbi:MAG: FixH family protein [Bacteroidota bacterium]
MNWGWKITIAYSLFGLFIGVLVFRSFQVNVDLVSEDYYQEELAYQNKIDKMRNERKLSQSLTFSQQSQRLAIQFPDHSTSPIQGEIRLFRPSDARFDQVYSIALDPQQRYIISTDQLAKGYYKVKVDWESGESAYYTEESIFIQ